MSGDDEQLQLASGHRVTVDRTTSTLVVESGSGEAVLTVELTESGPVLRMTGAKLAIEATEELALRADRLSVQARQANLDVAERLDVQVGSDAQLCARGTMSLEGRCVSVNAREGGMWLHANDDVDVRGERVRLNSDDPPMPIDYDESPPKLGSGD